MNKADVGMRWECGGNLYVLEVGNVSGCQLRWFKMTTKGFKQTDFSSLIHVSVVSLSDNDRAIRISRKIQIEISLAVIFRTTSNTSTIQ